MIAEISLSVVPIRHSHAQLAVVVDDAPKASQASRGVDLLCSTPQQLYFAELLGLGHPRYAHIPLLVAERNRRLSKRDLRCRY